MGGIIFPEKDTIIGYPTSDCQQILIYVVNILQIWHVIFLNRYVYSYAYIFVESIYE